MLKNESMYKTGIAPEGAGYFRLSLWEDDLIHIENLSGIIDLKSECIKIRIRNRIMAISGGNLSIKELDGCNLKIKGEIFRIEYLT